MVEVLVQRLTMAAMAASVACYLTKTHDRVAFIIHGSVGRYVCIQLSHAWTETDLEMEFRTSSYQVCTFLST